MNAGEAVLGVKLKPAYDVHGSGDPGSRTSERKVVQLDVVNLQQRRDALALECSYQIDVLMLLANHADELDGETQRSAMRSLTIRTRELSAILMSLLRGAGEGIGDWELRVFGSMQGSPTAPASDMVQPPRIHANFEPI